MIERLNAATNLIAFLLVVLGAVVCLHRPDIGANIITGAFGLLAGHRLAEAAQSPKESK